MMGYEAPLCPLKTPRIDLVTFILEVRLETLIRPQSMNIDTRKGG